MKGIKLVCAVALAGIGGCAVDAADEGGEATDTEEQAATQADVWHSTWNGGSANASFWSPTSSGYIDAFEYKQGSTRYAYLNLSTWSADPTSQQCVTYEDWWMGSYTYCYYTRFTFAYGWGQIPAGDFQVTPGHARVKTTLGASFGGYQCTVDYANWSWNCGAATGGQVDVRFTKNGQASWFSSGTQQQTYGAYTFKSQGTSRSASATATGTVLGATFTESYGSFGDTRGVNVSKSVIQTPNP